METDVKINVMAHDPMNRGFGYVVTIQHNDRERTSYPDFKTYAGALAFAADMFASFARRAE